MSDIYVVITEDRDIDVDVQVFEDQKQAELHAQRTASINCRPQDHLKKEMLTGEMVNDGWVLHITCNNEGGCVRVVRRELQ